MVDELGADKFSIYKLAGLLGVKSQSIYNYFSNRDELLTAIGYLVLEEVKGPGRRSAESWQEWLERASVSYYNGLCRHPNAMSLLLDRRTHPLPPAMFEAALSRMSEANVPPERGLILVDAVAALALSWAGQERAGDSDVRFSELSGTDYPILDRARSVRMPEPDRFRIAVRGVIAGLGELPA